MIQRPYFILILALVAHTYTIHTCIYTIYIPILYLFYTRILYFFTVLHFNKKYIWSNLLFYTRFVFILLFAWQWTFQDITRLEHVYMRPEANSNRFEISLRGNISLWCEVTLLSAFTWLGRSETHFGANFTSVKLTEVKFQTTVSFPCKQ